MAPATECHVSFAEALCNRVQKNRRHLQKWARREALEAYRLYDRDIPEFPLAIDRYGDWLHVQVFEKKRSLSEAQLTDIRQALAGILQIPEPQVVIKYRRRQRGSGQYEKLTGATPSFQVGERDLRFEVNLGRYLDTGLFLDHRDTRQLVRDAARDKTFLNLFAYTGSFTSYAAAGGAKRTVTVDMSRTYQAWAQRNLVHNGFRPGPQHNFVQSDVLAFVQRMREARARFDLIMLDPPSFSNSKRMQHTFDVQRDHPELLRSVVELLAPQGQLIFSTNRQGFRLAGETAEIATVEEISERTVPLDFKRYRPHRCWLLQHD